MNLWHTLGVTLGVARSIWPPISEPLQGRRGPRGAFVWP